jgi:hypothetical protein
VARKNRSAAAVAPILYLAFYYSNLHRNIVLA